MLIGELREQVEIKLAVTRHAVESVGDVNAGNLRRRSVGDGLRSFGLRCLCGFRFRFGPAQQSREKRVGIDGLGDVVVHACIDTSLDLFH